MSDFPAVMPHHDLLPIFDDTWLLQGSVKFKPFVVLQRNMVVLRHGTELTLINAIRLNDPTEAALLELGTVSNVVKIGVHGMDDAYYADKFDAKQWGLKDRPNILAADNLPHPGLSLFLFELTKAPEAALLLDVDDGLLITCDSVQHWEQTDLSSFVGNLVTSVMGFKNPAQIGPPWRKKMTPEGGSLKPDFDRMVALPFKHLVGGHGGLCRGNADTALAATMERVFPPK